MTSMLSGLLGRKKPGSTVGAAPVAATAVAAPSPAKAPAPLVAAAVVPAVSPAPGGTSETWPCVNGCGWTAFGQHATCCRSCTGPSGTHSKDCSEKNRRIAPPCASGCGRCAFGNFTTCCRSCKGATGPHARDCAEKQRALGIKVKDDAEGLKDPAGAHRRSGVESTYSGPWRTELSGSDEVEIGDFAGYMITLAKRLSKGREAARKEIMNFIETHSWEVSDKPVIFRSPFEFNKGSEHMYIEITFQKLHVSRFNIAYIFRCSTAEAETSNMDAINHSEYRGFSQALASTLCKGDAHVRQAILNFLADHVKTPILDRPVQSDFPPFEVKTGSVTELIIIELTVIKRRAEYHISCRSCCSCASGTAVDGILLDSKGSPPPVATAARPSAGPPLSTVKEDIMGRLRLQLEAWQKAGLMQTPEQQTEVIVQLAASYCLSSEVVRMLWLSVARTKAERGGPASLYESLAEKHHGVKVEVSDLGMYSATSVNSCMFLVCAASIANRHLQGHDDCWGFGALREQIEGARDWSKTSTITELLEEHIRFPRRSTLAYMADMLRHAACEVITAEEAYYLPFFSHEGDDSKNAFHRWLEGMRGDEEGDELVMLALARLCGIAIQPVQKSGYHVPVMDPTNSAALGAIVYWGNDNRHWVWLRLIE